MLIGMIPNEMYITRTNPCYEYRTVQTVMRPCGRAGNGVANFGTSDP